MLPDLGLTATLGGELFRLIARDVPTSVFFFGYPEKDQRADWETWVDGMLARVTVDPVLGPGDIARFGKDRDSLARQYLRAVRWLTTMDDETPPAVLLAPHTAEIPVAVWGAAFAEPPSALIRDDVVALVDRLHVPPVDIWTRWSISEFLFTLRVFVPQSQTAEVARGSDLVRLIGKEPDA
jgi:hypothetical protein